MYATIALVVGLAFVGSYSHFRNQEIQIMKGEKARMEKSLMDQDQRRADEKAVAKLLDEQNAAARSECLRDSDREFDRGLSLNGTADGKGTYTVSATILAQLRKQRSDARDLCLKMYPVGDHHEAVTP